jgi:cytosine/adenosine deaminase-related metal-dependent hydrolase
VHLTDEEIDVLAHYQVKVSHNVVSNLKLASGVAPVPKMLKKGISLGLPGNGQLSQQQQPQPVRGIEAGGYFAQGRQLRSRCRFG